MNYNTNVTCCWGDPDGVMYMVEGEDAPRELDLRDNGYVFGIWDGQFVMGNDDDETASLMHDEFMLYYLYYNGWPKRDIVPIKDINEDGWDYDIAKDIPVEYDNWKYYDDDENVLPEYQMTYGELLDKLGNPSARGRVLVDHNNGWVEFIAFWSEPTMEEKKLIKKYINNPYVVVFNNINDAREFYLYEGNKVFTYKEWLQSGKYIPRIKKDEEAYNLHLMKAKDKWDNTSTFRDTRDAKNAKKLGNMTMAQYNSLIHQESVSKEGNKLFESSDIQRKFRNLISTAQLVKLINQHGYEGKYTEQAIYVLLNKYDIKEKAKRGGKSYFNRKNACNCIERHIFELREIAERLEKDNGISNQTQPEDDVQLSNDVNYARNDMSAVSRELLANDGVFGADENELYSTNESKKIINLKFEQFKNIFEGVDVNPFNNGTSANFSINNDRTDAGNSSYADTRFFGTRGDIAYGDGTVNRGYKGLEDEYKATLGMITLYKSAIRIVQHKWYRNVNQLFSKINAPARSKTVVTRILFDESKTDEEKINIFNGSLNRSINSLNGMQGKYDRINATVKTGKPGRPKRVSDDTIMPRYNVGLVPNTNVKLISLFEISDFNFSDAIKHGSMRQNINKGIGNGETINKIGVGARQKTRVPITYDDGVEPNVASNFSLYNVGDGHYKQQYGYEDKNYTSVAQFMDKSIMGAAYAIKKEGVQIDYIIDAPSSSKFNHYYCTNLSNKIGVEYRQGFFKRNMLNVTIDEDSMRKNGINERIIESAKKTVSNAAVAEITSYMTDCVTKFVDENYSYLNRISLERMSKDKLDRNMLIEIIREQSYYGLLNIKEDSPKTTNLYMYLVNHFAQYSNKNIKSSKFDTEHLFNEISKILKTRLSRKYQYLLSEIDQIATYYENILLKNGMKLSSSKKFKAVDIDNNVRPYLKNAYVVADKEMAYNENGILDKLRESLQGKHFLIVDEDMDSGATLQLLISALKDKELECSSLDRKPGRPKKNYITDDKITCLVNCIKK